MKFHTNDLESFPDQIALTKGITANNMEISQVLSTPFQFILIILFEKNEVKWQKGFKNFIENPILIPSKYQWSCSLK